MHNSLNIKVISAGAGTGKTTRLIDELLKKINPNAEEPIRPEGLIATTFTRKAASELLERIQASLTKNGWIVEANRIQAARIGTIHSVCGQLLKQFAFEAGISPELEVIDEDDQRELFQEALSAKLGERIEVLESIRIRFEDPDWQRAVKNIADAVRTNYLNHSDLQSSEKRSIRTLLTFFPEESKNSALDLEKQLKDSVKTTIRELKKSGDSTKKTRQYLDYLLFIENTMQYGELSWSHWVKLSKEKPAKACLEITESLRQTALLYASHPQLQEDIKGWIRTIFALASESLELYKEFKEHRGLIDYGDQETLVYELLDKESVCKQLEEDLDLLLVDEFQDTSPIQMAIFLKLANLAKQTIWVGDPKQSIYAFRGSDPALMAEVVRKIGIKPEDILSVSFRAREALVDFQNTLFVPAFKESHDLPEEQIRLKVAADRAGSDHGLTEALIQWRGNFKTRKKFADAIAGTVREKLQENMVIFAKESGSKRTVRPVDIAILCQTNDDCVEMASALQSQGLQTALKQDGLMTTAEARLASAALRRLVDNSDTLAAAEIVLLLSDDPKPENWLQHRLEFVQSNKPDSIWLSDHPAISALNRLQPIRNELSPKEILDEVIEAVDIRRHVTGWGNRELRLGNLEALRALAVSYENSCDRLGSAATVEGFLIRLNRMNASGTDSQGGQTGESSINVLTYHKAKGLEWPIVILTGLEKDLKTRLWGLNVVDDRDHIEMESPLSQRWLRYWPWPFGRQQTGIEVLEKIMRDDIYKKSVADSNAEDLRLLYVGITRARDCLVLPIREEIKQKWFDRTIQSGFSTSNLPQKAGSSEITLSEKKFRVLTEFMELPGFAGLTLASENWAPERRGRQIHSPKVIVPSKFKFECNASIGTIIDMKKPPVVSGKPEMELLGSALHDFFCADNSDDSIAARRKKLHRLLLGYKVESYVEMDEILQYAESFWQSLHQQFTPQTIKREWPMQMKVGNQIMRGRADLLLRTLEGWVIVDHKTSTKNWKESAIEAASQLSIYAEMVRKSTREKVAGVWVHVLLSGKLAELITDHSVKNPPPFPGKGGGPPLSKGVLAGSFWFCL